MKNTVTALPPSRARSNGISRSVQIKAPNFQTAIFEIVGTAPLVIASTTKVSNLNVDLLDGGDWASPAAIGTTAPAAITGTTVTSTGCLLVVASKICSGTGSPEGVLTAPVGSQYHRTDGGAGTVFYTKETGAGNTGWVAMTLTVTRLITGGFAPTYGASVAIDAALGAFATITATNNTAFTIGNPTNPTTGEWLSIQVRNTSGAALGVITWDTLYKMATFTKPATGYHRTVTFRYNGTNWDELNCSPEVPN